MSKASKPSCEDCYFRRAGLCALPLESPCPTFRPHRRDGMTPPPQAQLLPKLTTAEAARAA
jgi:hypothetical protein